MTEVTQLLNAIDQGDPHAAAQLLPLVYDELRRLASQWLGQETPGQTLQPTALVHEAYVRLTGTRNLQTRWANRRHFFAAAAEAMRRLVVENARRKKRHKHGGDRRRVSLEAAESMVQAPSEDLLALDEALTRLTAVVNDEPRPIRDVVPDVPQWLCEIIARLHAKRPEDRFATAREVAELLGRCLAEMQPLGNVAVLSDITLAEVETILPSRVFPNPRRQRDGGVSATAAVRPQP